MDINWQTISIYGDFVTSLTAYYSCADINATDRDSWNYILCYNYIGMNTHNNNMLLEIGILTRQSIVIMFILYIIIIWCNAIAVYKCILHKAEPSYYITMYKSWQKTEGVRFLDYHYYDMFMVLKYCLHETYFMIFIFKSKPIEHSIKFVLIILWGFLIQILRARRVGYV